MKAHDVFTRRQFLATSAAGAVVLASSNKAVAQATQPGVNCPPSRRGASDARHEWQIIQSMRS
jgi:hypothetical protein